MPRFGCGSKFGMKLASDKPGMFGLRQLDHLAQAFSRRHRAHAQSRLFQPGNIFIVDFITMAVALDDFVGAINFADK